MKKRSEELGRFLFFRKMITKLLFFIPMLCNFVYLFLTTVKDVSSKKYV